MPNLEKRAQNINPKDKMTAQEIHMELKEFTQSGEINNDNIS
ncbi:10410_t:CDS:2 [Dentiscutata heterogama]|uniref:10410_t:CDS:1 n=1 Tax=Dentiscutata heterogama TaxID=1316150 RepID=A0ACA9LZE2_9GLOM|nr:10410_t:CDS:2 [Dentiscutata heterogama]